MLRDYLTQDIFTIALLISLVLIVSAKQLFNARFVDFLGLNFSVRYLKLYAKERTNADLFNVLLFLNLGIGLSIFTFLIYSNFVAALENNVLTLAKLFVAFGLIITLKISIKTLISHFFEVSELIKTYLFLKISHLNFSGLILFIFNSFLLFSFWDKTLIIYLAFGLLVLINVIGFIRFLRLYQKTVISNFFYFLLYLCALEIAPYVILYKVFKDYFG